MASLSQSNSYSSSQPQQDASNAYKYEDPTAYQIPSGYPANQFEVPLPVSRPELEPQLKDSSKAPGAGSSEPKIRLRKACDSCSVRKVKVRVYPPLQVHALTVENSATRAVLPANHALRSISLAHSIVQVAGGDRPTGTRKPSRDRSSKAAALMPPEVPPPTMLPTVWLPCRHRPICRPNRYATCRRSRFCSTTTSRISMR